MGKFCRYQLVFKILIIILIIIIPVYSIYQLIIGPSTDATASKEANENPWDFVVDVLGVENEDTRFIYYGVGAFLSFVIGVVILMTK